MNNLNPFLHARFHIYLLQLENYDLKRFLNAVRKKKGDVPSVLRLGVTWTSKLQLVVILSILIQLICARLVALLLPSSSIVGFLVVLGFLLSFYVFYLFLGVSVFLIGPLDRFIKKRVVSKARKKIQSLSHLTVIGITGSYGKTTMKEIVAGSLAGSLNVVATEENKNTPLGISRQILSAVSQKTDVFVVEMGAYVQGDIKELVELVSPNVVILTGINEAHLERQGSIENTIKTKFEIVTYAPKESVVILNQDDKRVASHADSYVRKDQTLHWYTSEGVSKNGITVSSIMYENRGVSFTLSDKEKEISLVTQFLPPYIVGDVMAAYIIANHLGVRMIAFKEDLAQVTSPPHRLSLSKSGDLTVIDDSYNGNPEGARAALDVLKRFKDQRKIYVTPGFVEMGEESHRIHRELGEEIGKVVDVVVLIRNSVSDAIQEGLRESGLSMSQIHVYNSAHEAHLELKRLVQKGDVVLFQNDWPENYI